MAHLTKNPHPSGRPIRHEVVKKARTWYDYPAETFATPRLRPKSQPTADAIGYKTTPSHIDEDYVTRRIGFVFFDD